MSINTPGGKGSRPRSVDRNKFESNWDKIFGKKPAENIGKYTITTEYTGFWHVPTPPLRPGGQVRYLKYIAANQGNTVTTAVKLQQAWITPKGDLVWEDVPTVDCQSGGSQC